MTYTGIVLATLGFLAGGAVAPALYARDAVIEKSGSGDIRRNELRRSITVGGDWAYPPFEYLDEHGEPDGFNIELLRRVAEVMNIDLTINLTNWSEARRRLEEGEVDMLAGMYRAPRREELHDFTVPHFTASYGLFVPRGSHVSGLEELEGGRVLVHDRDIAHDFVEQQSIEWSVVTVDDWVDVMPALSEGLAEAALFGMAQGMREIRSEGYRDIEMVDSPVFRQGYAMAVVKGDSELLAVLNDGLNVLKGSGEFDELYEKWFGVLEPRPWWETRVARILLIALALTGTVTLVAAGWVVSLRTQVFRQTCRLRESLAESSAARGELIRANEAKSRVVATVSHELRTPLHGVMGMTDLLTRTSLSEDQRSLVDMMQSAIGQLRRVLSDLLDYSRMDSGRVSVVAGEFRLCDMTGWLEPVLREMAEDQGLEFHFAYEGNDRTVVGDRERIAQIVINLVGNAVKFTESGTVSAHLTHAREMLTIVVDDTGPGIARDAIDTIFDPFVQLGTTEATAARGLGLGLPIVRSLVEAMGGTLTVESTVGVGSTFEIAVPLPCAEKIVVVGSANFVRAEGEGCADPTEGGDAGPGGDAGAGDHANGAGPAPAESLLASRLVLIAEDEAINRVALKSHLENAGATVVAASDGVEAVEAVRTWRPSLVLMDISMPNMTGTKATSSIREWEKEQGLASTPIIALSAHAQTEDITEFFGAGIDGYVAKPFRAEQLLAEISRVLGGS